MSRPIRDKLLGLDADLEAVRLPAASSVRARGKRRAYRRKTVGAAAVAATAMAGVGVAVGLPWSPETTGAPVDAGSTAGRGGIASQPSCVTPSSPLDLALPADPSAVTLQVVDATGNLQRSAEFTDRLRTRGFTVSAGAAPGGEQATATTVIRYGPSAVGAATVLAAYVDGPVSLTFVPDRNGRTVDLVLGESSVRLRSATEINEALVRMGQPSRPAELCAPGRTGN